MSPRRASTASMDTSRSYRDIEINTAIGVTAFNTGDTERPGGLLNDGLPVPTLIHGKNDGGHRGRTGGPAATARTPGEQRSGHDQRPLAVYRETVYSAGVLLT